MIGLSNHPKRPFILTLFFILSSHQILRAQVLIDNLAETRSTAFTQFSKGNFIDALNAEKQALTIAQEKYGPFHPSLVPILDDLGAIYRQLGRYEESEKEYKWGLTIREQTLGLDDPSVADSLDYLASLYNDLNREQEAEFLEQRACRIREKTDGAFVTGPSLQSLFRLGLIQIGLQKYELAEKNLQKCSDLSLKSLGPRNPLANESLVALSQAELSAGQSQQAESNLQKSLELQKKNFTDRDYQVGDSLKTLGDFLLAQGKPKEARENYEKALLIHQLYTGGKTCDFNNLTYFEKTAADYRALGDHLNALKVEKLVLKALIETFGYDHPQVAICEWKMAVSEAALGMKDLAKKHLQQGLTIFKTSLGDDHPLTLGIQNQLSQLIENH